MNITKVVVAGLSLACVTLSPMVFAARIADITNTRHNFSASAPGTLPTGQTRNVQAQQENQICVFCHTPHGADKTVGPLWNRALSNAQYQTYNSSSLDATGVGVPLDQPNGVSKLCLSCHDGTMAIGAVNVLSGSFTDRNPSTADIAMRGTEANGTMPGGPAGATSGFTRRLGTDLTNDHPISVVFDARLASNDGEMRQPNTQTHIVVRGGAQRPATNDIQLEPAPGVTTGGLVQCNSCHDPHIRDPNNENIKFLRLNRLQKVDPVEGQFSKDNDIICLACHQKAGWVGSAHANSRVGDEMYTNGAATVREFPANTQVWQTACLACHDTHTVQGARRLMREGVDGPTRMVDGHQVKVGTGQPAIEETCYACHGSDRGTLQGQGGANFQVPDTKTDFTTGRTHMPIATADQAANREMHDIGTRNPESPGQEGKDFLENPDLMGRATLTNRHAECTDCHNPHRVIKNAAFNANPAVPDVAGTHRHEPGHTNIASGVLKGIWGVEPTYGSDAFGNNPVSFTVKRGNPNIGASTAVTSPWVTREYQVCLKCHSNYAYGNTPPMLGSIRNATPPGVNGLLQYTNQAMEYNSPQGHRAEGTSATPSGSAPAFATNNHRSWHPVRESTGRTPGIRNANPNNWIAPWNAGVGTQTMYCTDCHGNATTAGTAVPSGGVDGAPWGPHGSDNFFILKGAWSGNRQTNVDGTGLPGTGGPASTNHLCFKCHQFAQYGTNSDTAGMGMGGGGMGGGGAATGAQASGFQLGAGGCMGMGGGGGGGGGGCMGGTTINLHLYHHAVVNTFRCNLCHVAIPHGWKNKVFLVNLNDVGPEGGEAPGTQLRNGAGGGGGMGGGGMGGAGAPAFTRQPYYNRAALKVVNFAQSGTWVPANCGSAGPPGNGATGVQWMMMSSESCNNLP